MVGADRVARDVLGLDDDRLASGVPLSAAFEFDRLLFRPNGDKDIPARVMRAICAKIASARVQTGSAKERSMADQVSALTP